MKGSVSVMAASTSTSAPLGRMLTAMVTPMHPDGEIDYEGAARLATYLVDEQRNDGLIISGTTGEAPTTTDEEKDRLLREVIAAVGDRATVVAGVGTNDTRHSLELAKAAEGAGAHALLAVTPYYNKPPQEGLIRHFTALADATDLPVMLYDIPGRTGTPIAPETLVRLADHPSIVAVKDAKDDIGASSWVLARTDLAYYCGTDMMNLPLLSIGASGFVSVVGHIVGSDLHDMIDAYTEGDTALALAIHRRLTPVYTGIFRTQGVITTKAVLDMFGLPGGAVRTPLAEASTELRTLLREDLAAAGVKGPIGLAPHQAVPASAVGVERLTEGSA
jgi:4-hydroxy-tetrahydrodipicolinate synthase